MVDRLFTDTVFLCNIGDRGAVGFTQNFKHLLIGAPNFFMTSLRPAGGSLGRSGR
jgi:hypothetical protein